MDGVAKIMSSYSMGVAKTEDGQEVPIEHCDYKCESMRAWSPAREDKTSAMR